MVRYHNKGELAVIGAGGGIGSSFPEIEAVSRGCRFNDCIHTGEDGCAVGKAIEAGEIDEGRYNSYLKLTRESEFHQMSYAERRGKDRDFGRFIKTVKKNMKKHEVE